MKELNDEEKYEYEKRVNEVFLKHGFSNLHKYDKPSSYVDIGNHYAYREYGSSTDIGNMIQVEYIFWSEYPDEEIYGKDKLGFSILATIYAKIITCPNHDGSVSNNDNKDVITLFIESEGDDNYFCVKYSYDMFEKVEKKIESVFDIVEGKLKNVLHFERM